MFQAVTFFQEYPMKEDLEHLKFQRILGYSERRKYGHILEHCVCLKVTKVRITYK